MKLSVIIVNYRTPGLTSDCLKSLLSEMRDIDGEVIVVDNNSDDNSVDTLRNWIGLNDKNSIITLIESPTNSGFSEGNNIGIRASDAEYYLLLNSDTIVRKGAIKTLLDTAETHREAGIISPRLLSLDGKSQVSCFRFPSPASEFIDAVRTGPISKFLSKYIVAIEPVENITRPQWTSFACVLIRTEVFQDIGLMDEEFFMYFEDVEFCHRARKGGWDILHTPVAEIVHLHGMSSGIEEKVELKKRLPKYYYAARARCFYLLYGRVGLLLANLLWSFGRIGSKAREFIERREAHVPDKQWLDIWINWARPNAPKSETAPR